VQNQTFVVKGIEKKKTEEEKKGKRQGIVFTRRGRRSPEREEQGKERYRWDKSHSTNRKRLDKIPARGRGERYPKPSEKRGEMTRGKGKASRA